MRKREKERLRVCDHELREKTTDRFFSSSSLASLPSSSRSENATKCKSSHVLRTYTFANVETIELIVSTDKIRLLR